MASLECGMFCARLGRAIAGGRVPPPASTRTRSSQGATANRRWETPCLRDVAQRTRGAAAHPPWSTRTGCHRGPRWSRAGCRSWPAAGWSQTATAPRRPGGCSLSRSLPHVGCWRCAQSFIRVWMTSMRYDGKLWKIWDALAYLVKLSGSGRFSELNPPVSTLGPPVSTDSSWKPMHVPCDEWSMHCWRQGVTGAPRSGSSRPWHWPPAQGCTCAPRRW